MENDNICWSGLDRNRTFEPQYFESVKDYDYAEHPPEAEKMIHDDERIYNSWTARRSFDSRLSWGRIYRHSIRTDMQ